MSSFTSIKTVIFEPISPPDFESDPQHFELQVHFWGVPDGPEGLILEPLDYTVNFYISVTDQKPGVMSWKPTG